MANWDFDFSHMFDPTEEGIFVVGTYLTLAAVLMAVAVLLPPLALRRTPRRPREVLAGILIGDCLLFVFSALALVLSTLRPLGLMGWFLVFALVPSMKYLVDGAWLAAIPGIGAPQATTAPVDPAAPAAPAAPADPAAPAAPAAPADPPEPSATAPPPPRKETLPWVAGIAAMAALAALALVCVLFGADPAGKDFAAQALAVLLALLGQGGGLVCLVVGVMTAATAPRRLRESGGTSGAVRLSRLAWLYPGAILLFAVGSALVAVLGLLFRERAFDSFGPWGSFVLLVPLYAVLFLFPTVGTVGLAAAYLRRRKEGGA